MTKFVFNNFLNVHCTAISVHKKNGVIIINETIHGVEHKVVYTRISAFEAREKYKKHINKWCLLNEFNKYYL